MRAVSDIARRFAYVAASAGGVALMIAATPPLAGCGYGCGCRYIVPTFKIITSHRCVTRVDSSCPSQVEFCNFASVSPPAPDTSGTCDVAVTLEDGTTLTTSVRFTYQGTSCCGPGYSIEPPTLDLSFPADASADGG